MKVLITGSTGLLGNNILRRLTTRVDFAERPTALIRGNASDAIFSGTNARLVQGDVRDPQSVRNAVRGCEAVIHSAGMIHLGWKKQHESLSINRDGTANIASLAREYSIPMVFVGTTNVLPVWNSLTPPSRTEWISASPEDETVLQSHRTVSGTDWEEQLQTSYVVSKKAALQEVFRQIDRGLDARIVHPGLMFGPWDWKPSSGRMIQGLSQRWAPMTPRGGITVSDVRDVADSILHCITMGTPGRQYILGGHNLTYKELWDYISGRFGHAASLMPMGAIARASLSLIGDAWTKIAGRETELNSGAVGMSKGWHWYDSSLAIQEIRYRIRDWRDSIDDTIRWMAPRGFLTEKALQRWSQTLAAPAHVGYAMESPQRKKSGGIPSRGTASAGSQ